MIRIPDAQNNAYSQPNQTDLYGNIFYCKNITFRDKGYAKLLSRVVAVASQKLDANFLLPLSFGRQQNGAFFVATASGNYNLNLQPSIFSISQDTSTNVPQNDFNTTGKWFNNKWHVVNSSFTGDSVWYRLNGFLWNNTGITLTHGVSHPIEVFRSRNAFCVAAGNVVQQFDSSYAKPASFFDLTIPTDYEITGLSFNNNRMAVATKLSNLAAGQNQNSFFFTWDGKSVGANGSYDTGSDMTICVVPYKSQWLIITRNGQALPFNGGGFDDPIFTLPYWFKNINWGDSVNRQALADCITTEGDNIYFNLATALNTFSKKGQFYLENYPGGLLCWDPNIGFHLEYAPSASIIYHLRVANTGISTTSGVFSTLDGTTIPITGNPIKYVASAIGVGGLVVNTVYYIIRIDSLNFKLAATHDDAIANNPIIPTSTGDAINTFLAVDVVDYGVTYTTGRTGGVVLANEHTQTYDHVLFGTELPDYESNNNYGVLNVSIPGFRNIGYIVTPKIESQEIMDQFTTLVSKFKVLNNSDKIIVKIRNEEVLGIPVTTPQTNGNQCTWTGTNTFTVIADLAGVLTYLADTSGDNACECEIISGAGAGQMSQITSITLAGSTYTVTLTDQLEGVIAGRTCNVQIINWKPVDIASIDDTLEGYKNFSLNKIGKFAMFKIILDGVDIILQDQNIINQKETPLQP